MTENQELYRDVLNEGYILHWYEVKSVLGRGAFGVTYLALDKNLDQLVAIKEYFPHDFSSRASGQTVHPTTGENRELFDWGLSRFIREAQTLAKFKHHNIVRVMSVFELNNTAYMVMEYEQGEELSKVYKRKKYLSEQELLNIFLPILDGLKLVHDAGFIHRDIKPANIYIREDGSAVLIDFGAARQTVGTPTRAITSLVTYGYAPFEQYNESDEKQGAWTDIYALGACLYLAVTGKLPLDALARGSSLLSSGIDPYEPVSVSKVENYSPGFLRSIDHALMFHAQDRPQDILVWSYMLSGKMEVPPIPTEIFRPPSSVNDEDATVIMTRPPSVSLRRGTTSQTEQRETTPGSEPVKSTSGRNVKLAGAAIVVLSLIATITIIFSRQEEEQPEVVEHVVQQEASQQVEPATNKQQITSLLQTADEAYKAGKLLNKKGGAIYLYQQILELDHNNSQAKDRIQKIIELNADGIRSDVAEGFLDNAKKNIDLLQAAVPESETVMSLMSEVQTALTKQNEIKRLLKQAKADYIAGRLNSPQDQNALSSYRQILKIAPDNQEANQGVERILSQFVSSAKKNLAKGNTDHVERNIKDILSVDPDSAAAKELRSKLNTFNTLKTQQQKVTQLISEALRAFEAGNIINPVDKNALALYQRVLELDAKNAKAKQGITNVEKTLKSLFKKHLTAADFTKAEAMIKNIEEVMPKSELIRDIRAEWERSKPASRPDMEVISEIIGKFKQGFESRDINALRNLSEFQANRQAFLQQFFNNYTTFRLDISDVKFIGHERKGTASIAVMDLVNIHGAPVEPGTWSRFEIVIRKNTKGQWKIFW